MFPWEIESRVESKQRDNEANRSKQAVWAARHPEERKAKDRRRRENDPEYLQRWRSENPERVKEHLKKQYSTDEHRIYMREYMRKYRERKKKEAEEAAKIAKNEE
ncbi:MAG: hypothetical protein IJ819_00325 [Clostridiales bacterium]|nr:hypothetical protein [Clostridiales bacterium]